MWYDATFLFQAVKGPVFVFLRSVSFPRNLIVVTTTESTDVENKLQLHLTLRADVRFV